ncbi:hypothetical protein BJX76DRAFT_363585 [Aspergillus varians]
MAHPNASFKCTHCGKPYTTSSHLRRHEAAPQKRGRKRKACNQCALGRVACDGDAPCESCLCKNLDCSYARVRRLRSPSQPQDRKQGPSGSQQIPIDFLLNYTDPSVETARDLHCVLGGQGKSDGVDVCDSVLPYQFSETWLSVFHAFVDVSELDMSFCEAGVLYGLGDSEGLASTVDRLAAHLDQLQGSKYTRATTILNAEAFLSQANVIRFVNAFFNNANHSNCIIHKGSFNVNTASTNLVLAIILLGATSISPEDAATADALSEAVEHSVFEGPEFKHLLYQEAHPTPSPAYIQLVQAAGLILVLRISTGQLAARRRIRIQRIPALVSAARLLKLTQVLNDTVQDSWTADYDEYIHKETLVRIMAWVYLLDTHCVVFSNSPPQFRIFEADFGLPQNDMLFTASDPGPTAPISSITGPQNNPPLSLRLVVQRLMDDTPHTLIEDLQPHINTYFALCLILSALHCVLFDLQALGSYANTPGVLKPIERALDKWKVLWESFHKHTQQQPGESQPRFMVHSMEFWWLAKMLVKHPRTFRFRRGVSVDSVDGFHDMVKGFRAGAIDWYL